MPGIPFENTFVSALPTECAPARTLTLSRLCPCSIPTGGLYDDLTLWEQIDDGAQYTPAKKWLTSVPIGLCVPFLIPLLSSRPHGR